MILLENGTACNAQACGVQVVYRDDAAPAAHIPVISSLDEVDRLQVPDPYTAFPMCEIIKATRILIARKLETGFGFAGGPTRGRWTWQASSSAWKL